MKGVRGHQRCFSEAEVYLSNPGLITVLIDCINLSQILGRA